MTGDCWQLTALLGVLATPASRLAEPAPDGSRHRSSVAVRKAVLMALVGRCDAAGEARARVRELAASTGYGDRVIRDALHALVAAGWVVRAEATQRSDGSRAGTAYDLDVHRLADVDGAAVPTLTLVGGAGNPAPSATWPAQDAWGIALRPALPAHDAASDASHAGEGARRAVPLAPGAGGAAPRAGHQVPAAGHAARGAAPQELELAKRAAAAAQAPQKPTESSDDAGDPPHNVEACDDEPFDVDLAARSVVAELRDRPPLVDADLGPLHRAVGSALRRGCGHRALTEQLAAALPRAHTPGLLVRVAADASPVDCPSDRVLAERDAVTAAWQAGRDRLGIDHPDEHTPAAVAGLVGRVYPGHDQQQLRRAFVAGWGGHPLTAVTDQQKPATVSAEVPAEATAALVTDGADDAGEGDDDRAEAARMAREQLRRRFRTVPGTDAPTERGGAL